MQTLAVDATAPTASPAAERGMNSLQTEDFFKILVTELRHQDPFEPAKTADMIGQVSQIRSIELSKQLTDTLSELTRQQHTTGASELLGKFVTAAVRAADGSEYEVSGIVTGVRFDPSGAVVLELDTGKSVLAADVTRITSPELAEQQMAAEGQAGAPGDSTGEELDPKSEQSAKGRAKGFLPWLSLDGVFHL